MKILLASLALTISTGMASAAVYNVDFANEADTNGERGVASGTAVTIDDVDMNLLSNSGSSPYLDASSGGKEGGLGACKVLDSNDQCSPSSDDNAGPGEAVGIQFADDTFIVNATLRDGDHNLLDQDETVLISFNGGVNYDEYEIGASGVVSINEAVVAGSSIVFTYGGANPSMFYISQMLVEQDDEDPVTPVPLPAGLVLLLTGLGGFGALRVAQRLTGRGTA